MCKTFTQLSIIYIHNSQTPAEHQIIPTTLYLYMWFTEIIGKPAFTGSRLTNLLMKGRRNTS